MKFRVYFFPLSVLLLIAGAGLVFAGPVFEWAQTEHYYFLDAYNRVLVDANGNAYTCFDAHFNDPSAPPFLSKTSPAGDTLWRRTFDADSAAAITDMVLDGSGNVYLAMIIVDTADGRPHQGVEQIYANGDPGFKFLSAPIPPSAADGYANGLALDENGEVYFCGTKWTGSTYGFFTGKLNTAGVLQWERLFVYDSTAAFGSDGALEIRYHAGRVYVVGQGKKGTEVDSYDIVAACYDTSGTEHWVSSYSGAGANPNFERPYDLAIDSGGNMYVAGTSSCCYPATTQNGDFLLMKFDSVGQVAWDYIDGGVYDGLFEIAEAVEVDHDGNIVAVGNTASYSSGSNTQTVKFTPAGIQLWIDYGYSQAGPSDYGYDLLIDPSNNIYIGGSHNLNMLLFSLDPQGDPLWDVTYNGPGTFTCALYGLAFGPDNSIYGAGKFGINSDPLDNDFALLKWTLPSCCSLAGDANNDGSLNVSDLTYIVAFLFQGGSAPACPDEGDMNADCSLDVADLTALISHLFQGGPAPVCGCVSGA